MALGWGYSVCLLGIERGSGAVCNARWRGGWLVECGIASNNEEPEVVGMKWRSKLDNKIS